MMKRVFMDVSEANSTREEIDTSEHFFEFNFRASSFGRVEITINLAEMAQRIERGWVEQPRREQETPNATWTRHLLMSRSLDESCGR